MKKITAILTLSLMLSIVLHPGASKADETMNLIKCVAQIQTENQIWRELTGNVKTSFTVEGLRKSCLHEINAAQQAGWTEESINSLLTNSLNIDR